MFWLRNLKVQSTELFLFLLTVTYVFPFITLAIKVISTLL